ncbi:hypothetical protein HBI81_256750 [Parastagonospora nodorum]|nr:hypothetical protein HBI32_256300 [Parastagonospora nodorum]KAH6510763.1 hypothetical protein HBI81_256750 [Parastagonospora nodorum]
MSLPYPLVSPTHISVSTEQISYGLVIYRLNLPGLCRSSSASAHGLNLLAQFSNLLGKRTITASATTSQQPNVLQAVEQPKLPDNVDAAGQNVYWNSKTAPEHLTAEQKKNWVPATEAFAPNTDENYIEDEEIKAQAQLYRIGAAAGAKSRSQRRAMRPPEIQKIWRPLYLAVRSWWTLGSGPMPGSSKTAILNSNKNITQLCERYAEAVMSKERWENHLLRERFLNSQRPVEERASDEMLVSGLKKLLRNSVAQKLGIKYRLPGDEMFVKIQEVVKRTGDLEGVQEEYSLSPGDANAEAAYKKHQDDLLQSIPRLLQTLRAHDIPLASVVTEFAKDLGQGLSRRNP